MSDQLLRFAPVYQERVWGAQNLASRMGRVLPAGRPIGESWEIVDRPEAQSVVTGGLDDGKTIRELIEHEAATVMGPRYDPSRPFPILVKWLDCADRLSLQVHPPAAVAPELAGEPKTENWYIAATSPGSHLIVGLKRGVTRDAFAREISSGSLEELVHRFPVSAGDSILVESGRLHAIDAGNLILEIQQNSDTTYRVFDWGRKGLDGVPRPLHVEESMRSIDFDDFEPSPLRAVTGDAVLADCAEFRIRKFSLAEGALFRVRKEEEPRILSVVDGAIRSVGSDESPLRMGDNAVLPWAGEFEFRAETPATFLLTDHFV